MSTSDEVTAQIMEAWDDISGTMPHEGDDAETEEPAEEIVEDGDEGAVVEPPAEEEAPEVEEESEEEEPGTEEEGEEQGEGEEEPEVVAEFESDDPEVRAFLAKYQGDVERALKGGMQMQQALSRQGREKQLLEARLNELETENAQLHSFGDQTSVLSPEQREWVGQALESGNPQLFVREAVRAGEFGLARAVCAEWGNEAPYEALRATSAVDAAEQTMYANSIMQPPAPLDRAVLLDAVTSHFPELPQYAIQMTETMAKLGDNHPLVVESRSDDPEEAIRGVIGIYEIARASTHALASTREQIKTGQRENGDSARKKAVVSSGSAPTPSESARPKRLGPGLTLEQLNEEWERQSK